MLEGILLGSGKSMPAQPQIPSAGGTPGEDAAMTVQFYSEPPPEALTVSAPELINVRVSQVDPPDDLVSENDSASAADDSGDSALFGRYMGQLSARIERAWLRPRTPVGDPLFSCQVRIEQDATGAVREVTLVRCNGSTRWQLSLVQAIQAASPLPAPPDPAVFKRTFSLRFQSQPYSPAVAAELYEPPQRQ
jgi:TonB C terminal